MPDLTLMDGPRAGTLVQSLDVPLALAITDIGATTAVEVWVGPVRVTTFHAHTRYAETAAEVGLQVVAAALRPLIEQAATAAGCTPHDPTVDPWA